MSRIGKAIITVPAGVTITENNGVVTEKGPKGELTQTLTEGITLEQKDGELTVNRPSDSKQHKALHGLYRALINNMVVGVTEGYKINMEIFGVGYRVQQKGKDLEFSLGYSHPILIEAPEGVTFSVDGNTKFAIEGSDKQQVGQIAANIRRLRKDDPYKGKGIRYAGEQVRRKVGKTGK